MLGLIAWMVKMRRRAIHAVTLSILVLSSLSLPAFADSIPIVNPDFSVPPIPCALGYAYQGSGDCNSTSSTGDPFPQLDFNGTPGFGWTFSGGGVGITSGGTAFQPPSFAGVPFTQAAFLQGSNTDISQMLSGFSAGGSYILNFYLGSRFNEVTDGNQTVEALINGNVIGSWALTSSTPFTFESAPFTAITNGSATLDFMGLNPGDHTAFLSHVSISSVPEPASLTMGLLALGTLAGIKRRTFFKRSSF